MTLVILSALGVIAAGTSLTITFGDSYGDWRSALRVHWSTGIVVGFGGLSLVGLASRFFALERWAVPGFLAAAFACSAVLRLQRRQQFLRPAIEIEDPTFTRVVRVASSGLLWGSAAVTASVFLAWCCLRRHGGWDAITNWIHLARILDRHSGPLDGVLERVAYGQVGYPHLVPGSIAALMAAGDPDGALAAKLVVGAFLLALVGTLHQGLMWLRGPVAARCGTAVMLATPLFGDWAGALYADVPFAAVWLTAIVTGLRAGGASRPSTFLLPGFVMGLLPWTKNEGFPMLVLVLLWTASWLPMRSHRTAAWICIASAVPGIAATAALKGLWAPANDHLVGLGRVGVSSLLDLDRWAAIGRAVAREIAAFVPMGDDSGTIVRQRRWGFFWPAVLAGVAAMRWPYPPLARRRLLGLAALAASSWLLIAVIFVLIPTPLEWSLAVSLDRLMLQQLPVLLLLIFGCGRRFGPTGVGGAPSTNAPQAPA